MANTLLTPILEKGRCIIPHVLQSFQDLADVVTAIKTHGSVKVIANPAGGNIAARGKSECPKRSGVVSTFITQISIVTVHVLHGESKPVLGAQHGPLTCECQLHVCTSLDRAQANTSSVLRIKKDTCLLITDNLARMSEERQCPNHSSHFSSAI